jgi:hypothetical protein
MRKTGKSRRDLLVLADQSDPPLLTVEEVAEMLPVPPSWVYERADVWRIVGLGNGWRFREAMNGVLV